MQQASRELSSVDLRVVTSDQQDVLGSTGQTIDGRVFRYAKIGNAAVDAAIVLCTPYTVNLTGLTVAGAAAAGIFEVKVTLGATAVAQNILMDGELDVLTGTGKGTSYRIRGNSAAAANNVISVYLVSASPLITAISAGSRVNLGYNLWYNLETGLGTDQAGSSTNKHVVGVTTVAMGANTYGWIQTSGRCLVTSDNNFWNGTSVTTGAIPKGYSLVMSKNVAGYITGAVPTLDADKQVIGYGIETPYTAGAGVLFPADLATL